MRLKKLDESFPGRELYPFEDSWHGVHKSFVCHLGSSQKNVTSTSTTQPWATQQPYLTSGFDAAKGLLSAPAPTQSNPVAPFNPTENAALTGIANHASNGTPIVNAANNFATDLENGKYLAGNPASGYFGSLAGSNLGLNNPGSSVLQNFANGTGNTPGSSTLQDYASGKYLNSNGNDAVTQSVLASVVPQIAKQFNAGNSVNNPALTYAASQGATAALAPLQYQNYNTQQKLQTDAASQLGANSLTGANAVQSGALAGGNLQATAAGGLGTNYNSGVDNMVKGNALAPQNQALSYADLDKLFTTGHVGQQQSQNEASGAAATSNFAQMSPYQQLQAYVQAVGGNYGQTGTQTTPNFTNGASSALSGLFGTAGLVGGLGGLGSLGVPSLAAAQAGIAGGLVGGSGILGGISSMLPFLAAL